MSDEQQVSEESGQVTGASDSKADSTAIIVMFTAAVLFCVFYISGWTFDL